MYISVFTDELHREVTETLPIFAEWGMEYVDFRGLVNGLPIEKQSAQQLKDLRAQVDGLGLKTAVIQSSLCKVHLPDEDTIKLEQQKLEGIIRACDALDCNMVRSFNFWQYPETDPRCGELAMRPDMLSRVLEMYYPIAQRAKEAGLILGFENCGQTPDEAIAVLEALNVPGWGLAWDVSNMFEYLPEAQGDCIDYFTKALKYANMLHVKCRGVLPEIDRKKVPWDRVLKGAAVTGKNMPVSIETHLPAGTNLTCEEATKRTYDYLKKVWPAAAPADMQTALSVKQYFDRPYRDNPVKMVVVGLGMGKNRCTQITETCGIELAGVCDLNAEKAKEVGEQFGVPYTTNLDDYLNDPSIEAVYVVTPTGTHCDIAERCLNAGKHVLVTKPMDANYKRCEELIQMAEEKGLLLGCDFDLHFRGPLKELEKAVADGFFGNLKCANTILNVRRTDEYYKENGGWRGTWALDGGGALSNQGIHEIDRLMRVFGMPDYVRCSMATQTFDIEAEDYGNAEWKYDNGMRVRIFATTSYPVATWYTRIEAYGDKGAYLLTGGGPEGEHTYWYQDGKWTENSPYPTKKEWNQAADNFANAIRTGDPLIVRTAEGRDARYLLDMMYQSAKTDEGWVKIEK